MNLWLNGERVDCENARTISELAKSYDLQAHTILIEHNGDALRPNEWFDRALSENDRIEFVRVVAGG